MVIVPVIVPVALISALRSYFPYLNIRIKMGTITGAIANIVHQLDTVSINQSINQSIATRVNVKVLSVLKFKHEFLN